MTNDGGCAANDAHYAGYEKSRSLIRHRRQSAVIAAAGRVISSELLHPGAQILFMGPRTARLQV